MKNIGTVDKTLRIIVGLVVIAIGVIYKSWWGALGVIPLLTALISFCPFYVPLKLSTRKKD